jgi:ribosomal protein S18 acetylase RimI-like enzyme
MVKDRKPALVISKNDFLILPLTKILKKISGVILSYLQSYTVYRNLAKKLFKQEVFYQWETLRDGQRRVLAMKNNKTIGRVTVGNFSDINSVYQGWWIFDTWVNLRYRGMGIGQRLTQTACDFVARNGALTVQLLVHKNSKPAINLYQKLGFFSISIPKIDRRLKRETKKFGWQQIIMQKPLQPKYDS